MDLLAFEVESTVFLGLLADDYLAIYDMEFHVVADLQVNDVREAPITDEADRLRAIDRMVSASVLAMFLRDFPLTHLTKGERRVFIGFQKYIVHLERQLFEEAGVSR